MKNEEIINKLKDLIAEDSIHAESWGKNIVILQRGWVVMGDLYKDDTYFTLKNGSVIRRWGTDKGLGQIALEGVQPETVLDPIPEAKFHELTTIAILKCL